LIRSAYGRRDIAGGPAWVDTARFDVVARSDFLTALDATGFVDQAWLMLRRLLVERFALHVHSEARLLPIYTLNLARGDHVIGSGMTPSDVDCAAVLDSMKKGQWPAALIGRRPPCTIGVAPGHIAGHALAGVFDVELTWAADEREAPSIFAALEEPLGLKLGSTKGQVEVLVINSASLPTSD
jgi:hypothetical protein